MKGSCDGERRVGVTVRRTVGGCTVDMKYVCGYGIGSACDGLSFSHSSWPPLRFTQPTTPSPPPLPFVRWPWPNQFPCHTCPAYPPSTSRTTPLPLTRSFQTLSLLPFTLTNLPLPLPNLASPSVLPYLFASPSPSTPSSPPLHFPHPVSKEIPTKSPPAVSSQV